jgi:hypothetical protein
MMLRGSRYWPYGGREAPATREASPAEGRFVLVAYARIGKFPARLLRNWNGRAFPGKVPLHRSSDADFASLLWFNCRGRRERPGFENSSLQRLLMNLRFETKALYSTFVLRSASPSTAEARQVLRPFHSGRALPMPVPESRER